MVTITDMVIVTDMITDIPTERKWTLECGPSVEFLPSY